MNTFIKGLYIVSTPIGNLDDITIRAKNILEVSDIILCEDTRHSLKLLNHLKIKKKLISYHKFNEKKEIAKIINYLKDGKILSLISDAGTPVLSDPGNMLINECVKQKINIIPIPGPTSITTAMSVSGFEDKFLFYGFLPKTEKEIEKVILGLKEFDYSIIFFTPSLKINFYLKIFKKHFIGRQIFIAREITKMHETFYRGDLIEFPLFTSPLKGELTVVISKKNNKNHHNIDKKEIISRIKKEALIYLKKYSLKDVVELIVVREKIQKKLVYEICLDLKKNEKKIN